ncbi:ATP-binding protein, ABC-type transporter [Aurantimonas manganoxydans SI85-9A1]|uniref:ATP-binding protein, ABC-type transporter n=1 Tax=Aurantimonas manganoxydans (strain ATCC BAA-1229 / DSM 21871 / SI85-9A1) TaxID=287752 RepID=Q1YES2_AURMS|nr:ATP-binding cassette domain-containing protein [Aurantimonas manganoxydans]EAS48823.1 ATP-binding protein, ABC-type transporter [Aurantimonas manganoxydans SI85-9A1]
MTTDEGLRLDAVEISLGTRRLLTLDRLVPPGQTLSVMGPSGSGKSTLFALIAGFLDPAFTATGRALLNGRDLTGLPPERRRVGLLFQDALLYPHMSVGGNLLFGLSARVTGRSRRRAAAEAMLERVGLPGHLDRDPATLSGGQAARVALARTLLADPEALLLDEPFSRLDTDLRQTVRQLVFDLVAERQIPALLVTHDRADAGAAGGPIVDLGAGAAS